VVGNIKRGFGDFSEDEGLKGLDSFRFEGLAEPQGSRPHGFEYCLVYE
jgi:hypothetical protein